MIIHGLIEIEKFTLGVMLIFSHKSVSFAPRLQTNIYLTFVINADVAKLADAPDLGSGAARHVGSTPIIRTMLS